MAVTQNLKGTSYPSFKIHKSGATLYQGSVAPSFTASHGDLYLQHGTDGALWLYKDNAWTQLGAGGTSTDTTIINNSTNTGSHVKQYVLFGETNDGNEHILAPTSAFSIDTITTTIDDITTSIDTGTVSGVIPVPLNSANLFEVRVVARSANPNNNAGYTLKGVIVNDAGTTTLINDATENILAESTSEWYSIVEANDNGDDSFVIKVSGSANTTVRWTAFVTLTSVATPQYTLSSDTTAVNEGDSVTFTLTTTHISDGTTIAYTITGIDQADLAVGNLTGTFNITNNTGTQTFTLANDATTEGTENMTLALDNGLASADVVVVTDTSLDPTYTLSADNTTINEGDTVTITLTTTDITDGTELAYTVTGVDADDLSAGSLTGNFTINNNTGTAVFTLAEDDTTEGAETLTLTLDNGEGSIAITITDTSLDPVVSTPGYGTPATITVPSISGNADLYFGRNNFEVNGHNTTDRYVIVGSQDADQYDGSTEVKDSGWLWLVDLYTNTIVKSWNPLFDNDHNDDGNLQSWSPSGYQSSKYHSAQVGISTAINSGYAFASATFRDYNQPAGAYIFAYNLNDYSIAKRFRLSDVPNMLPDDGVGSSANTDFATAGIAVTDNFMAVGSIRASTPGGNNNDPDTSEQEGRIDIWDISDSNPNNWSHVRTLYNPVSNSNRSTGPAGWWTSFGQNVALNDNYLVCYFRSYIVRYSINNGVWPTTPDQVWSNSSGNITNTDYSSTTNIGGYPSSNYLVTLDDNNILYYANGSTVRAHDLDTDTRLWENTNVLNSQQLKVSDNYVYVGSSVQEKVTRLDKTTGVTDVEFTSPNAGATQFGRNIAVNNQDRLFVIERGADGNYTYAVVFNPDYINNYVYPGYWEPGYVINPVVSSDISNFVVDTNATFSADANNIRPHGSQYYNWYGNSGLSFNADGTQMYWKETSSWYGFTLSTPYDTGTAVRDTNLDPYNYSQSNPFQYFSDHSYKTLYHTWSGDGRRYFLSGGATGGAGWDIRTADPDYSLVGVPNIGHDGSAETSYSFSWYSQAVPDALGNADNTMNNSNILFFNDDGTRLYMAKWESGYLSGYVTQYDLTTPYTCNVTYYASSFTSIHTKNLLTQPDNTITQGSQNEDGTLEDVKWSSDGTKLFMLCESNIYDWVGGVETKRGPTIYQVDCSTPYDITTASYTQGNHIVLREAGVVTTGCYPSMAVEGNQIWVNVHAPTITGDSNTYTGTCLVKLHVPGSSSGGGGSVWYGDRGLLMGGYHGESDNGGFGRIEYFDIATLGNSSNFGDLTDSQRYGNKACSNGTRAVATGGTVEPSKTNMEYVTIATTGNAIAFGDLLVKKYGHESFSDGTYGLSVGGIGGTNNMTMTDIEYITIATTGNGTDFGDLIIGRKGLAGAANATRGIVAGGNGGAGGGGSQHERSIEYITIATPGNALSFGDLLADISPNTNTNEGKEWHFCVGDATRIVWASGKTNYNVRTTGMSYAEFDTPGNSVDFGDITVGRHMGTSVDNSSRGVFMGGSAGSLTQTDNGYYVNTMDYVTIQTPGNAVDFGDLQYVTQRGGGASGSAA